MVSENWLKVSLTSMSLGVGLYFIPLAMIANETILNLSNSPFIAIMAFIKIALSLFLLSFSVISKSHLILRLVSLLLSLILMFFI